NKSPFEPKGTAPTVIGWAHQPLEGENAVNVNDIHPGGLHETVVVATLSMSFATGSLTLPADVIMGRLVNAEALGGYLPSSGSYAISHGQITFEFSLPSLDHFRVQSITLNQPVNPAILPKEQPGDRSGSSYVALYNWQTSSWEIIHLTQSIPFSTQNAKAYFSHDGRMLVQYVDQASNFSGIAFTMPSLTVTGIHAL